MKKALRFVGQNLGWLIIGTVQYFICASIYMELENDLPGWLIILALMVGTAIGVIMIVKVIIPYFEWSGRKKEQFFAFVRRKISKSTQ